MFSCLLMFRRNWGSLKDRNDFFGKYLLLSRNTFNKKMYLPILEESLNIIYNIFLRRQVNRWGPLADNSEMN